MLCTSDGSDKKGGIDCQPEAHEISPLEMDDSANIVIDFIPQKCKLHVPNGRMALLSRKAVLGTPALTKAATLNPG